MTRDEKRSWITFALMAVLMLGLDDHCPGWLRALGIGSTMATAINVYLTARTTEYAIVGRVRRSWDEEADDE